MSILKRRKTEQPDAPETERREGKLAGLVRRPAEDGTLAVFACVLSALLVPYLLRTAFFSANGIGLSTALQGAIALVTLALVAAFLGIALLRFLKLPLSSESALYAAIRLFCFAAPAIYLEWLVFCFCFKSGSYLSRNILFLIPALLAVYAASHTVVWAAAILYELDSILPSASLFGTTWKLHLKNPLSTAGRFLALFLTFWAGGVLFPLLSEKALVFLYRTIPGSILLAIVYACVLTVFVRLALRIAAEIVVRAFPAEETAVAPKDAEPDDFKAVDIELTARENARTNPSSAEELLIEKGLLTNEAAYGKPAARITDADIPVRKPLLPEKWTFRDFIPLVIVALLLLFVGGTALIERTTVAGVISDITTETRSAAAAETKAGNSSGASEAYLKGLGDLEAFDAYLNAIAGGAGSERPDEDSAQIETYSALFNLAENYSDTSSLPYLLEAKLLLKDGHPDLAAEVLNYMIGYEYDTDETYLLLL
ncbi:MAG: hypothetical protein IKX91_01125, partial [Firmicutes bacterium]|nr:hypothetical protein [Bacillota bacterium]